MAARVTCGCGWTRTYTTRTKAEFNARRHVCTAGQRQRPKARRADRHHRCARCGFEATYLDTTALAGRDFFNRHSCQKHKDKMVRAAVRQGREALIDRTPQPCLHKVANHQHGERATYVLDKCRCIPCSEANAEKSSERERAKVYGRYNRYVSAEFVRGHLAELAEYGIGLKQVAKVSGVSTGTLSKIVFGVYPNTGSGGGRNGAGIRIREPSRRVLRSTAEKIYDVDAIPANLGAGQVDHERTPLARLHLRALVALGWSMSELGRRLGIEYGGNACATIAGDRTLSRGTVDKVEALYAELSMTLPPETNQRQRISASRARRYAKDRDWLPPLDLEDLAGVELEAQPDVDEVAIQRRLNGDKAVRLTKTERREVVRRCHTQGMTDAGIHSATGISGDTVMRDRRALGLPVNEHPDAHPVSSEWNSARGRARRTRQEAS